MFKAMRKIERKPYENPIVHDKEGKCVTQPQELYKIVQDHFKTAFFKEDQTDVERFIGPRSGKSFKINGKRQSFKWTSSRTGEIRLNQVTSKNGSINQ